jgi:hypothetical protein
MSLNKLKRLALSRRAKLASSEVESEAPVAPADSSSAHARAPVEVNEPEPLTVVGLDSILTASEPKPKKAKKAKKPAPTVVVERKMIDAIKATFGEGVVTKKWGVKERALAKKLIETYTQEMTEQVIERFVAEWPTMMRQSRGRLYGLPTINFLWATQDRFFGAAQLGQNLNTTPANVDEYQGVDDNDDDW